MLPLSNSKNTQNILTRLEKDTLAGWDFCCLQPQPLNVSVKQQRKKDRGVGSLPPSTETIRSFCDFSFVVDRKEE